MGNDGCWVMMGDYKACVGDEMVHLPINKISPSLFLSIFRSWFGQTPDERPSTPNMWWFGSMARE